MKIDLHCHTNLSDGLLSPEQVVARAQSNGVELLAVTDHDSVAGVARAKAEAAGSGVRIVSGVEFSSQWRGINIHLVGLMVDIKEPGFVAALGQQHAARQQRGAEIGKRLDKLGAVDAYRGASLIAAGSQLGRPHFAEYLVRQGFVKDTAQAYKKYLGAGKTGDVKNYWPDISTAVNWVRSANGVAVLAHPVKYKLSATKVRQLLQEFKGAGGQALEVISGPTSVDNINRYARLSQEFSLYASCGSDFHGPVEPWRDIGKIPPLPKSCAHVRELF